MRDLIYQSAPIILQITNLQSIIFGHNRQGYYHPNHRNANPPEQPHITDSDPSKNVRSIKRQPDQERAHLDLEESTSHSVFRGLAYSASEKEDWSLGSYNSADFGQLPIQYTTCESSYSVITNILTPTINHLPLAQQHKDAQIVVWLQQVHDKSQKIYCSLTRADLTSVGVYQRAQPTFEPMNHPWQQMTATNQNTSMYAHARLNQTPESCIDGLDADPILRRERRHPEVHGHVCAWRLRIVDKSWQFDRLEPRFRQETDLTNVAAQKMTTTSKDISQSYGQLVTQLGTFV